MSGMSQQNAYTNSLYRLHKSVNKVYAPGQAVVWEFSASLLILQYFIVVCFNQF